LNTSGKAGKDEILLLFSTTRSGKVKDRSSNAAVVSGVSGTADSVRVMALQQQHRGIAGGRKSWG
jgi:hypothetical protein